VVFCTEDLQLIKGPGRGRRRFMDLLLSQTHATYLPLLQRYTEALRSRNALLKRSVPDSRELESFSQELVSAGNEIIRLRRELLPKFAPMVRAACRRIAGEAEDVRLEYAPGVKKDFAVELAQSQSREQSYRMTVIGPHRDELSIALNGKAAAQFGSEGQKRGLAIAVKLAQAEYVAALYGAPPILLIDDIMGELDAKRRSAFVPLLEQVHQSRGQVFMTATEERWPAELGRSLTRWHVEAGSIRPMLQTT